MVECSGCPPSSLWTSDMFLTMLKLLWFWSFLEPLKGCGESLVEGPWNWARQMDWGLKNHSVSCLSDQIYFSKESKKILNTHKHAKSDKAIDLHFECPWTVAVSKSWFVRFNPIGCCNICIASLEIGGWCCPRLNLWGCSIADAC